ncbi:hypothetical protein [Anatilimnocola floriformis]|uniref:hypothetical protein n=1 Tax=Anatilimnocola floriformis TaxID=2948575 RepID=UPI0020C293B9|nr:hypothetical protein [Anatilimnocola floriformis]
MTILAPLNAAKWLQPRFTLRALLLLIFVLSLGMAWYANWRAGKIREHAIERRLIELGGDTRESYRYDYYVQKHGPWEPAWLLATLPENCRSPVLSYSSATWSENNKRIESPLNDEVCGLIVQLPNLLRLELGPGSDHDFTKLRALPQLDRLTLCEATDADLSPFLNQRRLTELNLWKQPMTDLGLLLVSQNSDLRALELDDTGISDDGLRHLASLRKLEVLSLSGTQITSVGMKHLMPLQRLEILDLEQTLVDDSAVPHLKKLKAIRSIRIGQTRCSSQGKEELYQWVSRIYEERMRSPNGY